MAASEQDQLAVDLARGMVEQVAPQELPMFQATSAAYLKNPDQKLVSGKDDMLGFGAGEAVMFITPIALALAKEVIAYLAQEAKKTLQTESAQAINTFIKNQFKKVNPDEKAPAPKTPPLTSSQIKDVYQVAYKKAIDLHMSENRAKLFAEALVGNLALAGASGIA